MFESFWFFKFSSTIKYCSCYPKIFTYHFSLFSFQGAIFASQKLFSLRESNSLKLDSNYLPFLAYMKFCLQNFISRSSRLYFRWNWAFLPNAAYVDTQARKKVQFLENWWAQVDSNHRPHAYQACALTTWAMSPYKRWPLPFRVVEMNGIEPMTPCLQSRCSPSWATPPFAWVRSSTLRFPEPQKLNNDSWRSPSWPWISVP